MTERFYRSLYRIRRVEEEIARIYPTDKIKSPVHLSIGEEAVSVGICEALKPADVVVGFYRCHALYLAKGGDLKRMMAELYGKATGCARGKGGSMHLVDVGHGVMGASAVVGTGMPQAVGYAYGLQYWGKDAIVVNVFGDGAADEGAFHESLNFAALKRLPMLFVCENNGYAINSRQLDRQPLANIAERARGYGMPAIRLEDDDVFRLYDEACGAVARIREKGEGPQFIECRTYRWKEHVGPGDDFEKGYRSREEAAPWMANDQVRRVGALVDAAVRTRIEADVEAEISHAIAFAEESPFPAPEDLYSDVFKEN